MTPRCLVPVGGAAALMAILVLAASPLSGQGPSAYSPPRTPDGQPDLQGYWTNAGYAPLERPDNVTTEFYTPQEAAEYERRFVDREAEQTVPGTIPDVHYDHTQFGLDRSVAGYSSNLRTSLIVDPPNGKLPPLSAEGQRRAAERAEAAKRRGGPYDAAENLPLAARCLIMDRMGPPMLYGNYNNTHQIVQAPGYVMFLAEMLHDYRVIPLDDRPPLPGEIRQWMGSARGHWESDTLVVETRNFNGKNPLRGSSDRMTIVERFTRVDGDTIRYQFTVDDPATWTRPWSAEMPITRTTGPIFEHACHEGNYSLYNILAGARADEKKAQEAARKGSK